MNSIYRQWLISPETGEQYQLDLEDIDIKTVFNVSQYQDISKRSDTYSYTITYKGTQRNNIAFGNIFFQNRTVNANYANVLGFNYNPQRLVRTVVYEDGFKTIEASFRLLKMEIGRDGLPYYTSVLSGAYINFKEIVSNKLLTDIDFTDLKHRYTWDNIKNSWGQSVGTVSIGLSKTERFSTASSTYNFVTYSVGSGYVYPLIDYGNQVLGSQSMKSYPGTYINTLNFRPAIYVKEYFDRIISQPELQGYSYEVKGSPLLQEQFRSLIIPNNLERLSATQSGLQLRFIKDGGNTENYVDLQPATYTYNTGTGTYDRYMLLDLSVATFSGITQLVKNENAYILSVERNCKTDFAISLTFSSASVLLTNSNIPFFLHLELVKRTKKVSTDGDYGNATDGGGWSVISSVKNEYRYSGVNILTLSMIVSQVDLKESEQIGLRIHSEIVLGSGNILASNSIDFTVGSTTLVTPISSSSIIEADIGIGDAVTPRPPENIKQIDFITSLTKLFNFYVYTDKLNPKKLIFQTYDDYYGFSQPEYLVSSALDWTKKVIYDNSYSIKPNTDIPKNYIFQFKEDSDYWNTEYKNKTGLTLGTKKFTDSLGTDEKKVEVIFSPTVVIQNTGTQNIYPALYSGKIDVRVPMRTNIRILHWNGLKTGSFIGVTDYYLNGQQLTSYNDSPISLPEYPCASNYYTGLTNSYTSISDIHFERTSDAKFIEPNPSNPQIITTNTSYNLFYRNQTTELISPDLQIIDGELDLKPIDIANLNLRIPVFINFKDIGHSYYKVLAVEYTKSDKIAKFTVQKITK